ncbi:hypothetical protein TNCV_3213461 [Trichonephila clavipes]|nr:hypothetical protein TNCV_3213461 [Trichonephila clavipes]
MSPSSLPRFNTIISSAASDYDYNIQSVIPTTHRLKTFKPLSTAGILTRPAELVPLVPGRVYSSFQRRTFFHCAALFKTSRTALE